MPALVVVVVFQNILKMPTNIAWIGFIINVRKDRYLVRTFVVGLFLSLAPTYIKVPVDSAINKSTRYIKPNSF